MIEVFPSPFINSFNIYVRNFNSSIIPIRVYDSNGRLVLKKDLPTTGSLFYEIDAQALVSGIYYIKIQTNNGGKFVKKILKQ